MVDKIGQIARITGNLTKAERELQVPKIGEKAPEVPFIEYLAAEMRLNTLPKKVEELQLELKRPNVDKKAIREEISSLKRQILADKAYVSEHTHPETKPDKNIDFLA